VFVVAILVIVVELTWLGIRDRMGTETVPPTVPESSSAPTPSPSAPRLQTVGGGSLRGLVVSSSGAPVPGASVSIESRNPADLPLHVQSGANGQFVATALAPGLYSLMARIDGLVSDRLRGVAVQPGEETSGIRLVLADGGFLDVTVRDLATGSALDSCVVQFGESSLACDHDGRVSLGPLPAGDASVRVSAPGYQAQDAVVTLTRRAHTSAELLLTRGATVSGTVVDPNHQPVPGARVRSVHYSLQSPKPLETEAVSDDKGHFSMDGVSSGRLSVHATASGFAEGQTREFPVGPGEKHDGLEVQLSLGGTIVGMVVGANGAPVSGARVLATRVQDHSQAGSDSTGLDGAFRIAGLSTGQYTLDAETNDGHGTVSNVPVLDQKEMRVRITLVSESIDGIVHDPSGAPIAGAEVSIFSAFSNGQAQQGTITGKDGKFQASRLAGAPYRVQAHARGKGTAEAAGVAAGGHVELVLEDAGRITGVVQVRGIHPPDAFDVKLVPLGGDRATSSLGRYQAKHVVSPDGAFVFEDVPPGSYDVKATAPGRTAGEASTDVSSGKTSEVTLTLGDGFSVSGQVRRGSVGAPGCFVNSQSVTDTDGTFSVSATPPEPDAFGGGGQRLKVWAVCPDGALGYVEFDSPGDKTGVDIAVAPPAKPQEYETFGGIGAGLKPAADGAVTITSVMEGGPAFMAGVQQGDEIVAVNGTPTEGMPLPTVVQMIRGQVGTTVDVSILRSGRAASDVYIERDVISN
jgi:hypothetical protein